MVEKKTIRLPTLALRIFSFVATTLTTATIAGALSVYVSVSKLKDKVADVPTQQSVTAKYTFFDYRLKKLDEKVTVHTRQIDSLKEKIIKLQEDETTVWHPPLRRFNPAKQLITYEE